MQIWKAHFTDKLHNEDIDIINSEEEYINNPLSFLIDGVKFQGTGIGDFVLADEKQACIAKDKFSLFKLNGNYNKNNSLVQYIYELQRYSLDVKIPVFVVCIKTQDTIQGILNIKFSYKKTLTSQQQSVYIYDGAQQYRDTADVSVFSLTADGKCFKSNAPGLYFEDALLDINRQIKEDYYIKSCFTCQYSDYSPCGNDDFGTMLCYKNYKKDCLKVNNKSSYFKYLWGKKHETRQETYLCEEYKTRTSCRGYRGFV